MDIAKSYPKLIFGALQTLVSLSAITLAILLKLNAFGLQSAWNLPADSINFYSIILLVVGIILALGGILLVLEWRSITEGGLE